MKQEPFSRDEVAGLIEVYETLHPKTKAQYLIRQWAATQVFTEPAWKYLVEYLARKRLEP